MKTAVRPIQMRGDFTDEAEILKVLSHPARLKIVCNLIDQTCCVKDIWHCMELPQATVSQHLAALRARGIVVGKRDGNTITYEVVDPFVRDLVHWLRKKQLKEK
jgi:ArsR family transcriptional regulator